MTRLQETHLRLSTTLPSRTHQRRWDDVKEHHDQLKKPIALKNGRRFESLSAAMRGLKCSITKLYNLLDTGGARYL